MQNSAWLMNNKAFLTLVQKKSMTWAMAPWQGTWLACVRHRIRYPALGKTQNKQTKMY